MSTGDLQRFVKAQVGTYDDALEEITNGRKRTHWMWFIFPQIKGLGYSETSKYYAINDLKEAENYLIHPLLGARLVEICYALLKHRDLTASSIFGKPDDMKLKSCMTLFASVPGTDGVFQAVLDAFFDSDTDFQTLTILKPRI